jgi:conjugal transfer pilus assembly protein TrbC
MHRQLAIILCSTFLAPAWAQSIEMPSTQEIEQRMRSVDTRMPGAEEMRRAPPSAPNIDALPQVPTTSAPDLAAMASKYEQMRVGSAPAGAVDRALAGLLVFVSLGMPRPSLEVLVADAERSGALLVLRGVIDGSLKSTKAFIQQLIGKRQVAWRIDPTLFKAFRVDAVPTYVLVDPNEPAPLNCQAGEQAQSTQCGQPANTRIAGDVTIGAALHAMVEAEPSISPAATPYLQRLNRRTP